MVYNLFKNTFLSKKFNQIIKLNQGLSTNNQNEQNPRKILVYFNIFTLS